MPRRLKIWPNERVDITDFTRAANTFTAENDAFLVEKAVADLRARVLEGFRVELADQTANPGQITIHNGFAVDRDGRPVNDEDQANDSRTITLSGASQTFYVEIEFVEEESDRDARAFWDPTYDQTAPIPDGKEFSLSVSTRLSPTWRIVTPVSTTAFASTADANSTKIPLVKLVTNASNQILGADNPGLAQVVASSVMEEDVLAGVSKVRVLSARLLPAVGGDVVIDQGGASPETVTISAIDRDNGVITFAPVLASAHLAGAIVRASGVTATLVTERTAARAGSTHPDFTNRMWQGDEVRGAGIGSSKETFGSRSDLNVRQFKDYVDFLSSQIRELKFGHPRSDDTSEAPPSSFTSTRYFDKAGGVQGARNATVTIGNGTTSYGDLNGTTDAVFTAAIAALPSDGGRVYIKAGTYTFTSKVTVSKNVEFIGDGRNAVSLISKVAEDYMLVLGAVEVSFHNVYLVRGTGGNQIIHLNAFSILYLNLVEVAGGIEVTASTPAIRASFCTFAPIVNAIPCITATAVPLIRSSFKGCTFTTNGNTAAAISGRLDDVAFEDCRFTALNAIAFSGTSSAVSLKSCDITSLGSCITHTSGSMSRFSMVSCSVTQTSIANTTQTFTFTNLTHGLFEAVEITHSASTTASGTPSACFELTGDVKHLKVHNCSLNMASGSWVYGFNFLTNHIKYNVAISDTRIYRAFVGVRISGGITGKITVKDCVIDGGDVADVDQYGIRTDNNPTVDLCVKGCTFTSFTGASASGTNIRRFIQLVTTSIVSGSITGCHFTSCGDSSLSNVAGIYIGTTGAGGGYYLSIADNKFESVIGSNGCYGVFCDPSSANTRCSMRVVENYFRGISGDDNVVAVYMANTTDLVVSGNTVDTVTADPDMTCAGIALVGCTRAVVKGNIIRKVTTATPAAANTSAGIKLSVFNQVVVSENVIDCATSSAVKQAIYFAWDNGNDSLRVADNTIKIASSQAYGIRGTYNVSTNGVSNVLVHGNSITGMNHATGQNIRLVLGDYCTNISVTGNVIKEATVGEEATGIHVLGTITRSSPVTISHNTLIGAKAAGGGMLRYGILMTNCNKFAIVGNNVDWNAPTAAPAGHGIWVADALEGLISSNRITPDGDGVTSDIAVGGVTETLVEGNHLRQSATDGTITPSTEAATNDYYDNKTTT